MSKRININIGDVFNFLTVVKETKKLGYIHWECRCVCGNIRIISSHDLVSNHSKSCGCLNKEINDSSITKIFGNYKRNAEKRNLEFNINFDQFKNIINKNCFYCNIEPLQKTGFIRKKINPNSKLLYNGIDRVNNSMGYNIDNIVPCCRNCNFSKYKDDKIEFLSWIKRIYEYQKKLGNVE